MYRQCVCKCSTPRFDRSDGPSRACLKGAGSSAAVIVGLIPGRAALLPQRHQQCWRARNLDPSFAAQFRRIQGFSRACASAIERPDRRSEANRAPWRRSQRNGLEQIHRDHVWHRPVQFKGMVTGEPNCPVRHTWGEVHERARRIAGGLAAAGVGHGDAVAVLAGAPPRSPRPRRASGCAAPASPCSTSPRRAPTFSAGPRRPPPSSR